MPQGFNDKLANRMFKRKVIDMICNTLVEHVSPMQQPSQGNIDRALIIDYSSCPIRFVCRAGTNQFEKHEPDFMTFLPPLGEADIKFLRWAELFKGDILAHSVDGDFIPIALIRYEQLRHAIENEEETCTCYNIALHRLRYKMPEEKKKQKQDKETKKKQGGREYEYVNIAELYKGLKTAMSCMLSRKQGGHSFSLPAKRLCSSMTEEDDTDENQHQFFMRLIAVLIGLCGTDFSRSLPHISPPTMWNMLQEDRSMLPALMRSYKPEAGYLNVQEACNSVVAKMYCAKFPQHLGMLTPAQRSSMQLVLSTLKDEKKSKLSEKTRGQLPLPKRIDTTFRNINWLLQYWLCKDPVPFPHEEAGTQKNKEWDYSKCFPNPISQEFGFVLKSNGKVAWLDDTVAA